MILWRYILRSLTAPFVFGTSVIMAVFLLQYMLRYVNDLASKGIDVVTIGEFVVLNLSWIVVLAIPIGVLFATVMAFGAMSAANEVTVMKASGMGLVRMMAPALLAGCALWGFTFWYTDNVLPDTNLRLSTMMRDIQRLKPTFAIETGRFTTQVDGYTILARDVDSAGVMYGVTIYDKSRPNRMNVVNADTGRLAFSPSLTRLVLQLYSGEVHQSSQVSPNEYRVVEFDRHQITMLADRFFFEQTDANGTSRSDREMSIADMTAIVDRSDSAYSLSTERFNNLVNQHVSSITTPSLFIPDTTRRSTTQADENANALNRALALTASTRAELESETNRRSAEFGIINKYKVEIYKKYAIPAACILFVLVGCPLGIITKGGNFGLSSAISLGFYVLYWIALIGGEKLADRGILSPALAMWIGNIIMLVIGILVTIKVNFELDLLRWFRRAGASTT